MHYKRLRNGRPLIPDRPAVGAPSGFGRYGVLDDDGESILCHERGRRFAHVGAHLGRGHAGMSAAAYKRAHGLTQATALVASTIREVQSSAARARVATGAASWRRLEAARDPAVATAARIGEQVHHRGVAPPGPADPSS